MKAKIFLAMIMAMCLTMTSFAQNGRNKLNTVKTNEGRIMPFGSYKHKTTTSATATTIDTLFIPDNTSGYLELIVVGSTATGIGTRGRLSYGYTKTDGTITVAAIGADTTVVTDSGASAATFSASATAAGGNIKVNITGKASTTIRWSSFARLIYD